MKKNVTMWMAALIEDFKDGATITGIVYSVNQ